MRKLFYIFLITLLQSVNNTFPAQDQLTDSLKNLLKTATHDTTRVKAYVGLSEVCDVNEIADFTLPAIELCKANLKDLNVKDPLYVFYSNQMAIAYINMGYLSDHQGNIALALEHYHTSLKIVEKTNNKEMIAVSLINIGAIYSDQGDFDNALNYYNKSLKIREDIKDNYGIANSLNNLGDVYLKKAKSNKNSSEKEALFQKSLDHFQRSLKIREGLNDKPGIATCLHNMGTYYSERARETLTLKERNNYINTSLVFFEQSLKIREQLKDRTGIAYSLNNIATALFKLGKIAEAKKIGLQNLKLSEELGFPESIKNASNTLFNLYKISGNIKGAYEMRVLYIQMRDSLNNIENRKASIKSQLKYEYEKKAAADSVKVAEEKKLTTFQLKQEENQRYFLYCGLGLAIIFGGVMFNRFRITRKQKNIIEEQKHIVEEQKNLVEEKQKEIMDSIHYAKRVQQSLLPNEKYFSKYIKNNP